MIFLLKKLKYTLKLNYPQEFVFHLNVKFLVTKALSLKAGVNRNN